MKNLNAAFSIFRTQPEAENAVKVLEAQGIDPANITLILPRERGHDFGYLVRTEIVLGAIVGAIVGTLAGATIGALGGGTMFFDSPMAGIFFGAIMGFFLGAASGALVGIGTPQNLRRRYLDSLKDGSVLLSVHDNGVLGGQTLQQILEDCGGSDIAKENEDDTWQTVAESAGSFVRFRRVDARKPMFRWLRN